MDPKEIERRFLYHAPTEETRAIHDRVRALTLEYAQAIVDLLPGESREKSLTVTALEESSFWAHAHIARNLQ